jgi:hypothetical protein
MTPEVRSHVLLHRAEGTGKDRKHVAHDALVLAVDGDLLTVAFIDPALVNRLNDINFADAFERVFHVPPESEEENGHYFYTLTQEGTDTVLQAMADEGAVKDAESKAASSGKVRQIKGK